MWSLDPKVHFNGQKLYVDLEINLNNTIKLNGLAKILLFS